MKTRLGFMFVDTLTQYNQSYYVALIMWQPNLKLLILNSSTGFFNHTHLLVCISIPDDIATEYSLAKCDGFYLHTNCMLIFKENDQTPWKTTGKQVLLLLSVSEMLIAVFVVCDWRSDLHQLCLCVPECSSFIWRQGGSQAAQSQGYNTDLSRA